MRSFRLLIVALATICTKRSAHITGVVVKDSAGVVLFSKSFDPAYQPTVAVTFK